MNKNIHFVGPVVPQIGSGSRGTELTASTSFSNHYSHQASLLINRITPKLFSLLQIVHIRVAETVQWAQEFSAKLGTLICTNMLAGENKFLKAVL